MNDLNFIEEYKKFANILADESENIIMQYFRQNFQIEKKDDKSPVTIADKNSELRIRELIKKEYPNHGVMEKN
jgi:Archaeal fructose-1,6-bisphosphatase and related enzymes of inositol monophosphatase family